MFYGHYSCAWIIKVLEPKIPLWTLMIAVQIEEAHIVRGYTKVNDLKLVSIPYTHSLIAVIGWSILYGSWYRFSGYDGGNRAAYLIGLAVLSHWFEDLLVHNEDLLLLTIDDNAPKYGFKLWDYPEIHHPFELLLFFGSFYYYLVNTEVHPSKIYSAQNDQTREITTTISNLTNKTTNHHERSQNYWASKWGSIILSVDSFLTISVISTFLVLINPLFVHSYKTFSYNETEPGYQIYQVLAYRDGTSVVYLTKPINETCNEPRIDLRIIHPNGTVDKVEVDYPIPDFNFCLLPNDTYLHIALFPHMPEFIYILYENSTDLNSASYYTLLVTRTGKIISNTFLSHVSVENGTLTSSGFMIPHSNDEQGFLFYDYINESKLKWIYFSPYSNGNFKAINNGQIDQNISEIFPAIDGTFGIVTTINKNVINRAHDDLIDPTESTFELYITFVRPNKNVVDGPFLLYQTSVPSLRIKSICNSAYTTKGYFCILNIKDEQPNEEPKYHLAKIIFQSTGSVVNVEKSSNFKLSRDLEENTVFDFLYHGGFLVIIFNILEDTIFKTFQVIILDNNGNYNTTLDLPENITIANRLATSVFRNSYIVVHQDNYYTWTIYSVDLPKFTSKDNGYNNPNIKTTYPIINSNVPLSTITINVTYNFPITISTSNISIYQNNNNYPILRQSVPGNSPLLYSVDNKTIILDVLESTFNQPNANYYIVINDNVVKDWKTNQPLIGIESNIWKFNTTDYQDIFAEDAVGLFSLTTEGTKYFKSLSPYIQTRFLTQLRIDLANSIPVDVKRLNDINYEYDENQQIFLSLSIKSTTNLNERNVDHIMKDLDLLIKYKEITPISWFGTTNLIDTSFGFQRISNIFDDVKFHLIGIVIGVTILGLLYFYARKKHYTGKNIVIFKFSLIILDFILDILFIPKNGKKAPQLFIPSIMFCVIPTAINSIMSMIIILQEITKNKDFYEWFKNNTNIAVLFTILAGADLEVLNILSSEVAGIMIFSAPITKIAQYYIFWGSFLGFLIEDIPQFIIQVNGPLQILLCRYVP
ncbi:16437_t:CDS:10 [Funneliformis mosseae]|uniref:16437_t:CDS:1 n=1 Tax=Funneliformis mosseae TaxID=27381 RepID=A0A9N9A5J1_FUNMO|nr:16437_t:CDS:10 [Funneliformis mosseae]